MESKMLKEIKEYFANTPKEQIDKDWQEIEAMGFTSPTVNVFIENQKKHEIMETTQLQKAIVIAVKDGWVEQTSHEDWYLRGNESTDTEGFYSYTTDLNYLMPIAVKVMWEVHPKQCNEYFRLLGVILHLKLDEKNQYTELFEALYEAVKLLENE